MPNIDQSELDKLRDESRKLQALYAGGVDNWEFYGEALNDYHEYHLKVDKADRAFDEVVQILSDSIHEPSEHGAGFGFREKDIVSAREVIRRLIS